MALNHSESGIKKEHIVIAVLLCLLIGVVVYFTSRQTTPAPIAQTAPAEPVQQTPAPTNASQLTPEQLAYLRQQPVGSSLIEQTEPLGFAMAVGKWEGKIHPVINILNDLKGYKYDDSVAPEDTVYIAYDPRCPYCHALLNKLNDIDLKAKGITIKWLPTLALGVDDNAEKLATMGLNAKNLDEFTRSFSRVADTSGVKVTVANKEALDENMAFLFEASNQTFGPTYPKSVPAVFFIDKKTGEPNMMYGASQDEIFKQIFGD